MAIQGDSQAAEAIAAFGRVGTAMVTPFKGDDVDFDAVQALAKHLVATGNDMLVVSGTTGESPTTSFEEKGDLLRAVKEAVPENVRVVAGIGTNDTRTSIANVEQAVEAGADGLLAVTPYYSKPSQTAIAEHMRAIADASDLPVMLYDIPGRSGVPIEKETLIELAECPTILAVKDAKGDLASTIEVMASTDLVYYSGEDALNLPLLASGAVGVVSVAAHAVARPLSEMVDLVAANDIAAARRLALDLAPAVDAIMNHMPGVVAAKACLELMGVIPSRAVRMPLLPATADQVDFLRRTLEGHGFLQ